MKETQINKLEIAAYRAVVAAAINYQISVNVASKQTQSDNVKLSVAIEKLQSIQRRPK